MTTTTINFYNSSADKYVADKDAPNPRLFAFLMRCHSAGEILELGTGGGVDALGRYYDFLPQDELTAI